MIPFIFVIIVVAFLLLAISFLAKIYVLSMMSSMAIIVIGVYVLITGIEDIKTILSVTIGVISVCIGAYVFIRGSLEKIEEGM